MTCRNCGQERPLVNILGIYALCDECLQKLDPHAAEWHYRSECFNTGNEYRYSITAVTRRIMELKG